LAVIQWPPDLNIMSDISQAAREFFQRNPAIFDVLGLSEEQTESELEHYVHIAVAFADERTRRLTVALTESLKLQRHYAGLLNMHDGGQRIIFNSVDEWIERLKYMGTIDENSEEAKS
jgi:hypothetical protein